ncbi:MAG: CPXCG motif-containing cysteine-rich protein [Myxococcota bacterium]
MEQAVEIPCPTCGESTTVGLDAGAEGTLEVESDCQVCCRPLHVVVLVRSGHAAVVEVGSGW